MLTLLLLFIQFNYSAEQNLAECVPRCEMIKMTESVVPTQYNRCICDLVVENGELDVLSSQDLKCTPNYRSLKFRDKETGAVVLHKAVVGICNGLHSREHVNQSEFDKQEQEFRVNRNFRVAADASSTGPSYTQKHSWIDGFRSNIMQLYKKPDGHLRFG
ncbi:DUF19 domain-containing protein [Caenorhabditis elegans]|uniref:DUF19 domain-containing protein n=1 Tax=Caenorhabditis elegans TaxID=6239 RepID=Q18178_CAEEL|nr:DUF19 domain-containing protein [Caenorhabditis elegans]CCD65691.1 DUF19 domain-containing protein [Caenorhabditis elegans]|eukprot:NP_508233.2 Uncharacterized protein CELE_C25G6.4 [Caenorhabditis elegans]